MVRQDNPLEVVEHQIDASVSREEWYEIELCFLVCCVFFFSSRRRHTRCSGDWSSDVCSSDLERLGLRGTALWRLGSADTSLWPIWDATRPNDAIRQKIEDLPPGPDLILEGDGDVWHFLDTPKRGRRSISYDSSSDLITNEKYEAYPLSYRIDQIGAAKKKLAITFDDGPDWKWTPKILDVLKEKNVPATFFVIGLSADQWPQLRSEEHTSEL